MFYDICISKLSYFEDTQHIDSASLTGLLTALDLNKRYAFSSITKKTKQNKKPKPNQTKKNPNPQNPGCIYFLYSKLPCKLHKAP